LRPIFYSAEGRSDVEIAARLDTLRRSPRDLVRADAAGLRSGHVLATDDVQ
jgi:hypothetical protein